MKLQSAFIGVGLAVLTVGLLAQAPASDQAAFEVVSVKVSDPAARDTRWGFEPGGRFVATGAPLRSLIASAYGTPLPLPNFAIVGGPDWIDKDRFDITTKAANYVVAGPDGPSSATFKMLQSLLADRFKLVVHRESRELAIFALVTAKADGKVPTGLRPTVLDCAKLAADSRNAPPDPNGAFCGLIGGPGQLRGGSADMATLASVLVNRVSRVVVNRTGLDGKFDFELTWTPDRLPPAGAPPGPFAAPPTDGPSIFTALQEQLGLKLESSRGPVDVLVIDHVEKPTAN